MSEAEQREWAASQAMWELEMVGQPGTFSSLMKMDAMDVIGPAEYLRWQAGETTADRLQREWDDRHGNV